MLPFHLIPVSAGVGAGRLHSAEVLEPLVTSMIVHCAFQFIATLLPETMVGVFCNQADQPVRILRTHLLAGCTPSPAVRSPLEMESPRSPTKDLPKFSG